VLSFACVMLTQICGGVFMDVVVVMIIVAVGPCTAAEFANAAVVASCFY